METPRLYQLTDSQRGVTLSTGRRIDVADVGYDVTANRFYYYGADVTQFLTYAQRYAFPSFDVERTNAETSDAIRGTGPTGSTSTLANFVSGVGNDVAAASSGVRNFFTGTDGQTSDAKKLVVVLLLGVGLYLVWQIGRVFKR
jgi:hypothetical protein